MFKFQIYDVFLCYPIFLLDSEKNAQRSIYDASCNTDFGFCCDVDPETAHKLESMFYF